MIDVAALRERVERASRHAGPEPWVLAFDVNGIQELVGASGRPIAMRGASRSIQDFDAEALQHPGTVFAGGGRALELAPRSEWPSRLESRTHAFRARTHGGVLAAAAVPYDARDPANSLAWLRVRMAIAKDEAPPPGFDFPATPRERCADCGSRRATRPSPKPDAADERVCERCFEFVRVGRQRAPEQERWTLEDLSHAGKIAVVSGDGDNLGAFFSTLPDLLALAYGSELVSDIFRLAHEAARPAGKHVAPITGGDDIRVFLSPTDLLPYVERLFARVRDEALQASRTADLLPAESRARLETLSIGVGAVVADHHMPAWRLLELAHVLERSAKASGRGRGESMLDFALLTSGDEMLQGAPRRTQERTRPLAASSLAENLARARALRVVPASQRSRLLEAYSAGDDDAERLNLFRYQVARHAAWQRWYAACGISWKDAAALAANRPDRGMLELAELVGIGS